MRTVHLSTSERAAYGADRLDANAPNSTPEPRARRIRRSLPMLMTLAAIMPSMVAGPEEAERLATWDRVLG